MRANNKALKVVLAFSLIIFISITGLGIKMLLYPKNFNVNFSKGNLNKKINIEEFDTDDSDKEKDSVQRAVNEKTDAEKLAAQKAADEKSKTGKTDAQKTPTDKTEVKKPSSIKTQPAASSNTNTPEQSITISPNLPQIPKNYNYKFLDSLETEVLKYTNIEREKAGIKPLIWDDTLNESAKYKAAEMLQYNYFKHISPYTGSPWDVAKKLGYSYNTFGENIYMSEGYKESDITAKSIVASWMNSEGHKENILNSKFGKMAAGAVYSADNEDFYISQMFSN